VSEVALWRRLLAECLGSAFLAAVVVGSGIAAQHLSPGETGLELLENAAATAAGLFAIILMFGPVSGAHFNPVVSFADAAFGGLRWREAAAYLPAQVAGCIGGAVLANLMFAQAAVSISAKHRATPAHFLSEVIATLGLILVIFALARSGRSRAAPAAVGAYIGAAYFFTSSTSFANPAITAGRMFSDTFAGIAPSSAPAFIAAQIIGGALAIVVIKVLYPRLTPAEASVTGQPNGRSDAPHSDRRQRRRDQRRPAGPRDPGARPQHAPAGHRAAGDALPGLNAAGNPGPSRALIGLTGRHGSGPCSASRRVARGGCGVAGGLAHGAADGARGRLDGHDAVDDHGPGQPARCDMSVVGADGGAAVGADGDGIDVAAKRRAVEAVHGVASCAG
jgi:glycerol uptake facilitator-like aquaporin